MSRGRKPENRERIVAHVTKQTARKIRKAVKAKDPTRNTLGKVIDETFKKPSGN